MENLVLVLESSMKNNHRPKNTHGNYKNNKPRTQNYFNRENANQSNVDDEQKQDSSGTQNNSEASSKPIVCHNCKGLNHIAKFCRAPRKNLN